jgi:hypothetical protein
MAQRVDRMAKVAVLVGFAAFDSVLLFAALGVIG